MADRTQRAKGTANVAAGKTKRTIGRAAGSARMMTKGAGQTAKGKTQQAAGKARSAAKKTTR
jgi:uncharacterized protein YjbJ (UPF0337 family)